MTIAEKTANRKLQIAHLQDQIKDVLVKQRKAMGLDEIQYHLQKARFEQRIEVAADSTFDVRDALSEMVRSGTTKETIDGEFELVRE